MHRRLRAHQSKSRVKFASMRPDWTSQRCAGAAGRRSAPCVRNSSLLWGSARLLRAGASGRAGQSQCKHSTGCRLHGARHLTSQDVELSRKAQHRSRSSRTAGATQQFWRQMARPLPESQRSRSFDLPLEPRSWHCVWRPCGKLLWRHRPDKGCRLARAERGCWRVLFFTSFCELSQELVIKLVIIL